MQYRESVYLPFIFSILKSSVFFLDGENFLINLIDSPGHIDFSSEVILCLLINQFIFHTKSFPSSSCNIY